MDNARSVIDIGIALSEEKELNRILDLILEKALECTEADAASIYLTESIKIDSIGSMLKRFHPVLRFHRSTNRTDHPERVQAHKNHAAKVTKSSKVLDIDMSIAGYVSRTGEAVRIDDCYQIAADAPYRFNKEYDESSGYRTTSMLTVPMQTSSGKVRGVLQLINKLDAATGKVTTFSDDDTELMKAFASQACVAIENAKLTEDIENLFESFIRASITAIEARDPATSGHSDRVAVLTVELARATHQCTQGPYKNLILSEQQIREVRYAALLHDFGKIGVREEVLAKKKKLHDHELQTILLRIDSTEAKAEARDWREMALELIDLFEKGQLQNPRFKFHQTQKKIETFADQLVKIRDGIAIANEPQVMAGDFDIEELMTWIDQASRGLNQLILLEDDRRKLSMPRGTLTAEERKEIESHVSHTYSFLRQIAWTEDLSQVPDIAHAHHEKCDGTGYPCGLKAQYIPVQAKMMAIADIYDALTSMDRPYKRAVTQERALDILNREARSGKLDFDLLQIFIESGVYQSVAGMLRSRKAA